MGMLWLKQHIFADFLEVNDRCCMIFLANVFDMCSFKKANQIRISTMYINGTGTV